MFCFGLCCLFVLTLTWLCWSLQGDLLFTAFSRVAAGKAAPSCDWCDKLYTRQVTHGEHCAFDPGRRLVSTIWTPPPLRVPPTLQNPVQPPPFPFYTLYPNPATQSRPPPLAGIKHKGLLHETPQIRSGASNYTENKEAQRQPRKKSCVLRRVRLFIQLLQSCDPCLSRSTLDALMGFLLRCLGMSLSTNYAF